MRRRHGRDRRDATGFPRARVGFTLIETAIVLAITVVGALLVLPQWPLALAGNADRADATAGTPLARILMTARRQAIAARQVVTVYLDPAPRRVRIDTAGSGGRGRWQELELPLAPGESMAPDDSLAVFTFRPSGAAHGRPVRVRHSEGWVVLTVDPWHGEVTRALQ